jgi:probable rRNA maturation factor
MMLDVAIEADEEWDSSISWEELLASAARAAVAESAFPQLTASVRPVEISVRLTSDEEVRLLNAHWRSKDQPTNVLSFPMAEPYELEQADEDGPELLLGDVILAHGVCRQEATDKAISIEDHAAHLVVHGTLHLLGCDHAADKDAEDMEAREIRALARLGIGNPYETGR